MATSTRQNPDPTSNAASFVLQSSPVDVSQPYALTSLANKTILITGGASGFGLGFGTLWAKHGAHIILGDIDTAAGEVAVAHLRSLPGSSGHHHFQRCDVTNWADQVSLFRFAGRVSPTGGIDAVVANAGILDKGNALRGTGLECPRGDLSGDGEIPPPPNLDVVQVNFIGVLYTAHLALHWLPRNGGQSPVPGFVPTEDYDGGKGGKDTPVRDRHLLLISSIAGLYGLAGQPGYSAAKHGVTGLFRSLRGGVAWQRGIRVNMLAPYYVETPLIPKPALTMMAGMTLADVDDVIDAGTRLMADEGIVGRGLVIGPNLSVEDGEGGEVRLKGQPASLEGVVELSGDAGHRVAGTRRKQAVWEVYAHDYDRVEPFIWNYFGILNFIRNQRGWIGWCRDLYSAMFGPKDKKRMKTSY